MDALDTMRFPQLMELAKLYKVPGRGIARIDALRAGVRQALAAAAPAAPEVPVITRRPASPAAPIVWRAIATSASGRSVYRSSCGRWEIRGEALPHRGFRPEPVSAPKMFTVHDLASGGRKVAHSQRRLRDAKRSLQQHVEDITRAHTDAVLCERARAAGDANWVEAAHGQVLQALAEDTRRTTAQGRGPARLSGFGAIAAAHRAAMR